MIRNRIPPGPRPGTLALAVLASLIGSSVAAWATTKLEIAIAGEPWKDPSIAAVGPALTLAKPPGPPPNNGTLGLGWSTSESHAVGVKWEVKKNGAVVESGTTPLTSAAVPGSTYWIFIPAKFLAPQPPPTAVNYQITVTPYDATNKPLGAASSVVTVTQVADKTKPGPIFGGAAVFPTLELVSYLPNYGQTAFTQLFHELGTLTVRAHNAGNVPTNQMLLSVSDFNATMRQDGAPVKIPALAPGATMQPVTLHLKGILPPAQSQTPEDQQFTEWQRSYAQRCGVDLRGVMDLDMHDPHAAKLMGGHSEVRLFKGIGSSLNFEIVKPEVPYCDSKQCMLMSEVAKNIRSQLDSKVVGYAFFLAGCSSIQYGAYGNARTNADSPAAPFTTTTKMTVASVSKVVTALAAIRVIAEREKTDFNLKNGLDSPIGPFLPPWNWGSADQEKIAKITFRQLLSQTSGVRNYGDFAMDYDALKKFFTKPVFSGNGSCPGTSVRTIDGVNPAIVTDRTPCYSNFNFALFRVLLPRIVGYAGDDEDEYAKRYVQIVRDKVFAPLGITDVDCKPPGNAPYAIAYTFPGTDSGRDFGDRRPTCGGEGWYLSVEDLGHVLLSLNGADGRILTEAQFRDMETNPKSHAVGWDLTSLGSFRWVEKNGALGSDPAPRVNTSIGIFGSANTDPYVAGAVGVLFVNSNIADPPGTDVSTVLYQAFKNASKPKH